MHRSIALLVAVLAGLAAAVPARADSGPADDSGVGVPIYYAAFGSPRVDVLAGDSVTWRNDSVRPHSVMAVDGAWTSVRLLAQTAYVHEFDTPGTVAYYCQLHPSMRGEVDVHRVLLDPVKDPAAAGRPYVLTGRAALPEGATVAIEAAGAAVATAEVGADGGFRATVTPAATTAYTAVADGESAPPVQVLVLDRKVAASAHGRVVTARVAPASPGATVVLQLHLKEHFGWWPVATARVDAHSRARFVLPRGRAARARVVLTASDGATALARSAVFRAR